MANTRAIKRRILTASNIAKITKAMEMVSASKMRRAQAQAVASRAYARAIHASLRKVSQFTDVNIHPLLQQHSGGNDMLILFSTDRGLCGGLNTHLFKAAHRWELEHPQGTIVAIGKKAVAYMRKSRASLHAQFISLPEKIAFTDTLPISELLTTGFLEKTFSSVTLLYMNFINTLSQEVRQVQLLPLQDPEFDGQDHESSEKTASEKVESHFSEYVFEPNAADIFGELLPYYIEQTIFQTFLESKASEHSARMVAMKNASDNAKGLVGELRLLYNKSRQAAITNELLDITTATLTVGG